MNGGTLEVGRLGIGVVVTYGPPEEERFGYVKYFLGGGDIVIQDTVSKKFQRLSVGQVRPVSVGQAA